MRAVRCLASSSIVLTMCVLTEPAHAFRTAADLPEYAGAGPVRWATGVVTYHVNEQGAPGLSLPDVEGATWRAFSAWTAPSCASLDVRYGGNTGTRASPDGINVVEWLRSGWTERGFSPDAVATTDVTYERTESGWIIVEADIYLNAVDHAWVVGVPGEGTRDAESVLTHEAGHLAGLLHPCELDGVDGAPSCESDTAFADATMFPLVERSATTLGEDDVAGICSLYATPSCELESCPDGSVCVDAACMYLCDGLVCGEGERCGAAGCEPMDCGAACPTRCMQHEDCSAGLRCVSGMCLGGTATEGDPCSGTADCAFGECVETGYCAYRCGEDPDCASDRHCEPAVGGAEICGGSLRPLGAACAAPSECLGGACLAGTHQGSVCTRRCGEGHLECPSHWSCATVEGEPVCAPAPSSGCSVAPGATTSGGHGQMPFLVLAMVLVGMRRLSAPWRSQAGRKR